LATYDELARRDQERGILFEKLKELDKVKTDFFANVSHELRTPLTLILGPTEKVLNAGNLNDEQKRDLAIVSKNARGLLKQVNDLLDVAKLESGKMVLNYSEVDLVTFTRQIAGNFDGLALERKITFTIEAPQNLDNPDLNRLLCEIVGTQFNVLSAFDGKQGLERAIYVKPDIILADVMMPVMSGDQMVDEIRKRHDLDDIPIILLTAKADDELRIRLLRSGAQDYIVKPFYSDEVMARVSNLVKTKRVRSVIQKELASQLQDIEALTHQLAQKTRDLTDAVAARDEFLSIASHELKTPLTALKMQLQLTARNVKPAETHVPSPEYLTKAFSLSLRQVDALNGLIDELLDVAQIRRGQAKLHYEEIDLAEVIQETVNQLNEQMNIAQCPVELTLDRPVLGRWDRKRVNQIILNLVSNVLKYAAGKPFKIDLRRGENMATLIVQDFGPGIPPHKHEIIFKRFERASSSRNISGLGLGLFIVKGIVDSLGGTIQVESETGKGSTFIVNLPKHPSEKGFFEGKY
jgi:signal transduction histidine kinase